MDADLHAQEQEEGGRTIDASGPQLENEQIPEPEVLEEGPVHEAFAEPFSLEQVPEEVVSEEPPEPIQELPPEIRPEGENVVWIPGYWMWSPEREDYVWVSGLWRDVPPGRKWIPGDWTEVDGGWEWVSGYWADADTQEVQYLPTPPESLEVGPSSPAPGDNYLWAPGCWQYQSTGWVWQPGTWYQASPNYVYVPSHYRYTPYGSVYVNGYWDYPLARRGLLYAPVYWGSRAGVGLYRGLAWRPHRVINTALLVGSFFVDRGYRHYYYGYGRLGGVPNWLTPWGASFSRWGYYGNRFRGFDPIYAYHRWRHPNWRHGRGDRDGDRDIVQRRVRIDRPGDRGPRDGEGRPGRRGDLDLVTTPSELRRNRRENFQLREASREEIAQETRRAEQYREFSRRRAGQRVENLTAEQRTRLRENGRGEESIRERRRAAIDADGERGNIRSRLESEGNVVRRERRMQTENRGELSRERRTQAENRGESSRERGRRVERRAELDRGDRQVLRDQRGSGRARAEQRGSADANIINRGNVRTRTESRVEQQSRSFPRAENRARGRSLVPGERSVFQGEARTRTQVTPRNLGQGSPRTQARSQARTDTRSRSNYRTMRVPTGQSNAIRGRSMNRGSSNVAPRGNSGIRSQGNVSPRGNFRGGGRSPAIRSGGGNRGPAMRGGGNRGGRGPGMRARGGGRRGR